MQGGDTCGRKSRRREGMSGVSKQGVYVKQRPDQYVPQFVDKVRKGNVVRMKEGQVWGRRGLIRSGEPSTETRMNTSADVSNLVDEPSVELNLTSGSLVPSSSWLLLKNFVEQNNNFETGTGEDTPGDPLAATASNTKPLGSVGAGGNGCQPSTEELTAIRPPDNDTGRHNVNIFSAVATRTVIESSATTNMQIDIKEVQKRRIVDQNGNPCPCPSKRKPTTEAPTKKTTNGLFTAAEKNETDNNKEGNLTTDNMSSRRPKRLSRNPVKFKDYVKFSDLQSEIIGSNSPDGAGDCGRQKPDAVQELPEVAIRSGSPVFSGSGQTTDSLENITDGERGSKRHFYESSLLTTAGTKSFKINRTGKKHKLFSPTVGPKLLE